MKRLAVIAVVVLAGCATGRWAHPQGDEARHRRDAMECEYEARKATANSTGIASGVEMGRLQNMCMELRGYIWRRD